VEFTVLDILNLLGALCVFIFGMKVMSDGIQKAAGNRLRNILKGITSYRIAGVFTGFLITAILQTSSGTTVLVVSFANAGLLSLAQSISVIMGANIGTTLTAWMITYFGFKTDILSLLLPVMGIALPFYFHKKNIYSSIAQFFIGFGILFIGIALLKKSVPDLGSSPELLSFLSEHSKYGFYSVLLFTGIGTLFTVVLQSSSAATAITLALTAQGYIDFPVAAAIFLGENIGTTVTANVAAIVGNIHARRAALFHFIFNVIGVIWVLLIYNQFLNLIDNIVSGWMNISPFAENIEERGTAMVFSLALFHSLFNLLNVLLFFGFLPLLEKLVIKLYPAKKKMDELFTLKYISTELSNTAELSIVEAEKEIFHFFIEMKNMCNLTHSLLRTKPKKEFEKILSEIFYAEEKADKVEQEVAKFLVRVSRHQLSEEGSSQIRTWLRINNGLEKIGDICYNISKYLERKNNEKCAFTETQLNRLSQLYIFIEEAFELTQNILEKKSTPNPLLQLQENDIRITELSEIIREEHFRSIEKTDYDIRSGIYYNNIYTSYYKLSRQIININKTLNKSSLQNSFIKLANTDKINLSPPESKLNPL
jgi:phosphate:Na+ symporter